MEFWLIIMIVIIAVIGFFTEAPVHFVSKAILYGRCLVHMVASSDVKKVKDPKPVVQQQDTRGKRVRVVFVRHAESIWNSCFNRFGLGWPVRLVRATLRETYLWFSNAKDSQWIDSPLAAEGINQAQALAAFFASRAPGAEIMRDAGSCVVVSNLRRAMETAALGAGQRAGPQDRIVIESLLQEGTRNVDGASFTEAKKLPPGPMHGMESHAAIARLFDGATHNDGNKPLKSSVHQRIDKFALRVFGESRDNSGPAGYSTAGGQEPTTVIAVGHSLWFKSFFNRFLPATSIHVSKSKKLQNCAVVQFDLVADQSTGEITVDESTIRELYLGFLK